MSTPISTIRICKGIRLNNSYEHTIYFSSLEEQYNYFAGKVVKIFSAYSYLRKSWSIKVEATMQQAREWSYLFFNNDSNKYYYYFITNIEYINDSTVELFLEMDVMQTYHFSYNLLPCFIERQHAATDEAGDNILDEGLDLGDYVSNDSRTWLPYTLENTCILVLSTLDLEQSYDGFEVRVLGSMQGGIFSGAGLYATPATNYNLLAQRLKSLEDNGMSDSIIAIWMYPQNLINLKWETDNWTREGAVNMPVASLNTASTTFHKPPADMDGYIPDNNKLYTYPYNLLYCTNNSGATALYKYEYFDETPEFEIVGSLAPDGALKMYPKNYKGQITNYDEGIAGQNYPCCSWNVDVYKLWLAQNQNQHNLQAATAMGTIAAGAVTSLTTGLTGVGAAAGIGTMAGGAASLASLIAQKKDAAIQPPQAKGAPATATVNFNAGRAHFEFKPICIDSQHAKAIDAYFTIYGYKQNKLAIPERNVRQNFTYVKTNNCHIKGDFCNEDLTKIESIYNNGITFWKSGDSIGNYNLTNRPI